MRQLLAAMLAVLLIAMFVRQPAEVRRVWLKGAATEAQPVVPTATPPDEPIPPSPPIALPASGGQAELWPGATTCASWHAGAMDWCAPLGTSVHAPASGTLTAVGEYWDTLKYGAYVIITTSTGLEVYIGHLNHETVNPSGFAIGQWIEAGQQVGDLSEFDYSTPHSHVQLTLNGSLVGPGEWWDVWDNR